jgi:hypothetical protein
MYTVIEVTRHLVHTTVGMLRFTVHTTNRVFRHKTHDKRSVKVLCVQNNSNKNVEAY